MVKFLHWPRQTQSSRTACGTRTRMCRIATLAITLVACLFAGNASAQNNWTGTTPEVAAAATNDDEKTVFLYNVEAKQFLGKGGKWGTEAVISSVGTQFIVSKEYNRNNNVYEYRLNSVVKGEGASAGYLGFMNGVNSETDMGDFYVDRPNSGNDATTTKFTIAKFGTEGNIYQLQVTSEDSKDGTNGAYKGTFYLYASDGIISGVKTLGNDDSIAKSKWILVSMKERKDAFAIADASDKKAVPATFLMFDNDFARNDNTITKWQTKKSSSTTDFDGTLSWKDNKTSKLLPENAYPTGNSTTVRYYTYTYTGIHTWGYKKKYSHPVTYTERTTNVNPEQTKYVACNTDYSGSGSSSHYTSTNVVVTLDESKTTYEDIVESTGTPGYQYYNGCGYSIDGFNKTSEDEYGNKLGRNTEWQELHGGDWSANIHGSFGVVNQTIPNENMLREGWYKVSCVGFTTAEGKAKLYASAGLANDVADNGYKEANLTCITERPETYAMADSVLVKGGNTYEASVMVYVDKNGTGKLKTLSFGILVDGADDHAWTCFDNFQIEYYGNPQNVLLLDEDQTSVDYINKQRLDKNASTASQKFNVYLHRTVNVGKWNSIVLPVSLTVGQVQSAFGNDVHISAFEGATHEEHPNRMYFEAITVDRGNENNIAIEAGKLYIFKPSKALPTRQTEVKAMEQSGVDLTLTDYFTFIGVPFVTSDATPFTARIEGTMGNEIYGEGSVQFAGTYVWDGGDAIIPANSYVLKGNVAEDTGLWFYRTVKTKTKGFRGWLETNNKNLSFSINGVVDETTGISGLTPDNMTTAPAGIYNLNGQLVRKGTNSTEGLAKGIYVVGGRKVVVK